MHGIDRAKLAPADAEVHGTPLLPEVGKKLSHLRVGGHRASVNQPGRQGSLAPARLSGDHQITLRPAREPVAYRADDSFTADESTGPCGYVGRYVSYERTVHFYGLSPPGTT